MKVTSFERDVYQVESAGSSGEGIKEYRVDLSKEDFGCSCRHYHFRLRRYYEAGDKSKICKHIRAAMDYRDSINQVMRCIGEDGLSWFVVLQDGKYSVARGEILEENALIDKKLFDIGEDAWLMGNEEQALETVKQLQ